ncbi:hypothetical protein TWF569_002713 [Orbilia oligospora]|nr:hypothetical protein TWF706_008822 [Orbilia oligospora]KAF3096381.1 hypothetical protein TWF102_006653 [Orbilia oligospora]KAF3149263.1 hypothetical protein TWF594_011310 [Orbilia oligospora]KAF3152894.1 hypothetical protein TWF569_002713 [Orbilia oligospora]
MPTPKASIHSVENAAQDSKSLKHLINQIHGDLVESTGDNSPDISSRAVPHDFFFSAQVVCPTIQQWRQMDPDPAHYPTIDGPRPAVSQHRNLRAVNLIVYRSFRICRRCLCAEDLMTIVRNPEAPSWHLESGHRSAELCDTDIHSMRCAPWYGCYCSITMKQQDMDPDISVEAYQDSLNNLPFAVKQRNPDYKWKSGHYGEMGWQYDTAYPPSSWFDSAGGRERVPGTVEPYYLEGPDKGEIFTGPNDGLLRLPPKVWGSKFSMAKRDTAQENRRTNGKPES